MKKLVITSVIVLMLAIIATATAMAINNSIANNPIDSDPVEILTQNQNFINHGFEAKELKDNVKVNKQTAIEIAKKIVGEKVSQEATKITAVKSLFTDNETPLLPEKNINLENHPVWVVTFHGVTLPKNGPKNTTTRFVFADKNVVIDANSGDEIETFSYTSSIK